MSDERRVTDQQVDGAYALAILYTLGYFIFLGILMFVPIPDQNKELMLTLAGILSAAQLGIIKYFYDGSQGAVKAQAANIARSTRTDAVIQEIAKTAPASAAAAVAAATGAPTPPAPTEPIIPAVQPTQGTTP